jgi:hypothetical protein
MLNMGKAKHNKVVSCIRGIADDVLRDQLHRCIAENVILKQMLDNRAVATDKKVQQKDRGWTCDLVPSALIVAYRFAREQAEIKTLVVNHKWMARDLQQAMMQELLTGRTCLA